MAALKRWIRRVWHVAMGRPLVYGVTIRATPQGSWEFDSTQKILFQSVEFSVPEVKPWEREWTPYNFVEPS